MTAIPCACLGIFMGGLLVKKLNLCALGAVRMAMLVNLISTACYVSFLFLGCDTGPVAGVTVAYGNEWVWHNSNYAKSSFFFFLILYFVIANLGWIWMVCVCVCVEPCSQAKHQKLCASVTVTVTHHLLALCVALMGSHTCPPASLVATDPLAKACIWFRLFVTLLSYISMICNWSALFSNNSMEWSVLFHFFPQQFAID